MAPSRPDEESPAPSPGPGQAVSGRHALREQDVLWADFLALAASVVNSLEKSVQAICDGRFDLISEVENEEEDSDRREVLIEQQCLRILALYEPVAWDLRRMATVLKVNRDWERIADLALRVARRARKLRATPAAWPCPRRSSKWLAMCSHRYVQVTGPWPAETSPRPGPSLPATTPSMCSTVRCASSSRPVWASTPNSLTPGSS